MLKLEIKGKKSHFKYYCWESLLPFPTWGTGNISLFFYPLHPAYTLSCHTKINPFKKFKRRFKKSLLCKIACLEACKKYQSLAM
jgi:hypothetical protein